MRQIISTRMQCFNIFPLFMFDCFQVLCYVGVGIYSIVKLSNLTKFTDRVMSSETNTPTRFRQSFVLLSFRFDWHNIT